MMMLVGALGCSSKVEGWKKSSLLAVGFLVELIASESEEEA